VNRKEKRAVFEEHCRFHKNGLVKNRAHSLKGRGDAILGKVRGIGLREKGWGH